MSNQLLFYEAAVPVSTSRHAEWSVDNTENFSFAGHTNSVPLMAVEFAKAASEYTLVFAGDAEDVMPVAILGIQNDSNLYIQDDGKWEAKYIPAFVRRYPFVFSSADTGSTFTLCIDESYAGVNKESRGNRLFESDGERSEYLQGVLKFLQEYQTEFNRTRLFCSKLQEMELLEPMQAQIKLGSGKQLSLTGFQTISRDKLNNLAPKKLSELAKMGALELIYAHLFSLGNFADMIGRVATSATEVESGGTANKEGQIPLEDQAVAGHA